MVNASTTCLRATRQLVGLGAFPTKSLYASLPSTSPFAAQTRAISMSSRSRLGSKITSKPLTLRLTCIHRPLFPPSASAAINEHRHSSTTAAPATSSTPLSTTSASPDELMTWDRYLQLRTSRRRYNLVASIVSALGTTFVGAGVLASQDLESLGIMTFGLDPIVVMGMATLACGAVGWVLGPFAGSGIWGMVYKRSKPLMGPKERDFYRRITKYRSSLVGQSVNNPVPDYYGEKITSVKDYRRWLKDQRAFRKKREV